MFKKFIPILLLGTVLQASAITICPQVSDISVAISMKLAEARRLSVDDFEGKFEILNRGGESALIEVFLVKGKPYFLGSDIEFQFPDVNNQWVSWLVPVGTVVEKSQLLSLPPGSSRYVYSRLPPDSLFLSYEKSRLMARLSSPKECVVSVPFFAKLKPNIARSIVSIQ